MNIKGKKEKPVRIDAVIPQSIATILSAIAKKERRSRKSYIEVLLIKHSEENKNIVD
jgi:hypothetical protein